MADSATTRYKARKQSLGSNTNTWGDTKLNDNLDIFDRGSKGYQSVTLTGDTTFSWTNYSTSNQGQVQILRLAGSLSSAVTVTVPSTEWVWDVINASGAQVTMKTSAGTGIAIPNGRTVRLYCDATDVYSAVANYLPVDITETNNRDLVDYAALNTAVANVSVAGGTGPVKISSGDTTAGFLASKVTVQYSSATTTQVAGLNSLTLATLNAGANEQLALQVGLGYVGGFLNGGIQSSAFTPAQGTEYVLNCSSAGFTVQLGSMSSVQVGQKIKLTSYGENGAYLSGTICLNGVSQTDLLLPAGFTDELTYTANGWN